MIRIRHATDARSTTQVRRRVLEASRACNYGARNSVTLLSTKYFVEARAEKRVRATLRPSSDEGQDAHSRMAKELTALAEVGFARMVRPHLPQPVVEDLYPR